jgi:hypothetical protein
MNRRDTARSDLRAQVGYLCRQGKTPNNDIAYKPMNRAHVEASQQRCRVRINDA